MATRSFGFSPDIPSGGRIPSRHDGVADPQPTPLLTPLTRINPPNPTQASLSAFHDPTHDPNMGSAPVNQQMRTNLNSSDRSELCREHRRTRIYHGELLLLSGNRSNIPPVMPAENLEQRPPATPRQSFSLPIRFGRQPVHSLENENIGGRQNSISGDTDALPVRNQEEEEEGGLRAWRHSALIMHRRAWRAALDQAAYDQLMRQLGMPNTPSEIEHLANEQIGNSDTLEGNPDLILPPNQNPTSRDPPASSLFGELRGAGNPNSPSGHSTFGNSEAPSIQPNPNPNPNVNLNPSTGQVLRSDREAFEELLQNLASQEAAQQTSGPPGEDKGEDEDEEDEEE
jgi:hypothetical protein